jgi:hypothetical protein
MELIKLYLFAAIKTTAQLIKSGAIAVYKYIVHRPKEKPWHYKIKK